MRTRWRYTMLTWRIRRSPWTLPTDRCRRAAPRTDWHLPGDVEAPTYDDLARDQVALAASLGNDDDALQTMINGGDTWTVR